MTIVLGIALVGTALAIAGALGARGERKWYEAQPRDRWISWRDTRQIGLGLLVLAAIVAFFIWRKP